MEGKDENLFYLALQLTDTNPFQEGLTKKTMILDEKAKLVDYINCEQWFDTKFYLRSKPGTEIVIYISVLLEDVDFVNLMLSDEISCNETIFKILNQFRYTVFSNSDKLPSFNANF